jgi:hypothetical protein
MGKYFALLLLFFQALFIYSQRPPLYHWQNMEQIKSILDQSMLPHIQVKKQIITAIDTLQRDLQIGLKIDSSTSNEDKR